jgi:hypothetical protein
MLRKPIKSSLIKSEAYDPLVKRLHIELQSGKVYEYSGVSPQLYAAFLRAPSPGAYFNANIKQLPRKRLA